MSQGYDFDAYLNDDQASAWRKILNKINPKPKQNPVLKITMTSSLEKRIRGAMFMGRIDSVALFVKMSFSLMERLIDAKARGAKMYIQEKDGSIREIDY